MKPLGSLRYVVLERDEYQCQKCGTHDNLDVHHLIPERVSGPSEIDNLVTLCRSCHRRVHTAMGPGRYNRPMEVLTQPIVITQQTVITTQEACYYFPVRISKGGQITIPQEIRDALKVKDGDRIDIKIPRKEKEESPLARA